MLCITNTSLASINPQNKIILGVEAPNGAPPGSPVKFGPNAKTDKDSGIGESAFNGKHVLGIFMATRYDTKRVLSEKSTLVVNLWFGKAGDEGFMNA